MFSPESRAKRVVIVGGGFAGLRAARRLRHAPVEITLIDKRNHHLFQPLLYQVASAVLNPSDIAYPIRAALRHQKNVRVLLADARRVDVDHHRVELDEGTVDYDWLILATGATHSYFGHDEWKEFAPGLKTVEDALEIRRRILSAYEAAERWPEDLRALLTFVVVGGGPTGVELAGSLSEIARFALSSDFRTIDPESARVILIEGQDRLLGAYPPDLSESARHQLEGLGVDVRVGSMVKNVDADGVELQGGERIPSRTVLWAAGVRASPIARSLGAPLDEAGRVKVEPDLSVPAHPEIFVVGDLAAAESDGKPVPGVAPAAIQAGKHAARCVLADLSSAKRKPFHYLDKGSLATIGRSRAVAEVGRFHVSGFIAWFAWLAVHIFFLIGFRNRVFVMLSWAWSWLTFRRGARLITGTEPMPKRVAGEKVPTDV